MATTAAALALGGAPGAGASEGEGPPPTTTTTSAPEIDGSAGIAALVLLLGFGLMAYRRARL